MTLRRGVIALLASASLCSLLAATAQAQAQNQPQAPTQAQAQEKSAPSGWTWDWGGDEKKEVASSGKKVVPIAGHLKPGEIIVSFSDRRLYFVSKAGEALSYPIAIPRQQDDWKGVMIVSDKKINPSWTPTPTMIRENPRLPSWVPGGHPYNPLGVRALYLGSSAYRIHGTDAPWTIGEPVSKGCIRMYNKDVVDLYDQVKIGTRVTVTWDSFNGGPVRKPYDNAKVAAADDKQPRRDAYATAGRDAARERDGSRPSAGRPQREENATQRAEAGRERLYERAEREAAEKPRGPAAGSASAPAAASEAQPAAKPVKETREQARERERLEKAERERAEKAEREAAREAAKEAARERGRGIGSIFSADDPQESWTAPQERAPRARQPVPSRRVSAAATPRAPRPAVEE